MKKEEEKTETKKDITLLLAKSNETEKQYKIYLTQTIKKAIDLIALSQDQTTSELIRKLLIKIIVNNIEDIPELIDIILDGVDQGEKKKQTKKNNLLKSFNLDEEIIKEELKPIEPDNILTEPIKEDEPLTPKLSEEDNILNRVILLIKDKGQKADKSNLDRILKGNKSIVKDIKASKDNILKLVDKMEEAPTKNGIKNLIGYLDPKDKYKRKRP